MRQKGFIFLPILIIIALVGALGYFVYQNNQLRKNQIIITPNQIPSPSSLATSSPSSPTADWKSYSNTLANYTIKYPQNWNVLNYGLMEAKPADQETKILRVSYQPNVNNSDIGFNIEITPVVNISQEIKFDEERTIGESLAKCGSTNDSGRTNTFCWLKIPNQDNYLIFVFYNYINDEDNKSINQILSSFRFVN